MITTDKGKRVPRAAINTGGSGRHPLAKNKGTRTAKAAQAIRASREGN